MPSHHQLAHSSAWEWPLELGLRYERHHWCPGAAQQCLRYPLVFGTQEQGVIRSSLLSPALGCTMVTRCIIDVWGYGLTLYRARKATACLIARKSFFRMLSYIYIFIVLCRVSYGVVNRFLQVPCPPLRVHWTTSKRLPLRLLPRDATQSAVMRLHVVCLSVRLSVRPWHWGMFFHTIWNTSKIISRPNSLRYRPCSH